MRECESTLAYVMLEIFPIEGLVEGIATCLRSLEFLLEIEYVLVNGLEYSWFKMVDGYC